MLSTTTNNATDSQNSDAQTTHGNERVSDQMMQLRYLVGHVLPEPISDTMLFSLATCRVPLQRMRLEHISWILVLGTLPP